MVRKRNVPHIGEPCGGRVSRTSATRAKK